MNIRFLVSVFCFAGVFQNGFAMEQECGSEKKVCCEKRKFLISEKPGFDSHLKEAEECIQEIIQLRENREKEQKKKKEAWRNFLSHSKVGDPFADIPSDYELMSDDDQVREDARRRGVVEEQKKEWKVELSQLAEKEKKLVEGLNNHEGQLLHSLSLIKYRKYCLVDGAFHEEFGELWKKHLQKLLRISTYFCGEVS